MKKKALKGFLVTSILTGGGIFIPTVTTPIALAENTQEYTGLSPSLRKLGAQSTLIQMFVDQALTRPNIRMSEIPALLTRQVFIKQDLQEWSSEIYPHLILINAKIKGFTSKMNSYYPTLKQCVDNDDFGIEFSDRLEALRELGNSNQDKIQNHINELQFFRTQLGNNIKELNKQIAVGQQILTTSESGKIDQYKKDLVDAKTTIQKDLQEIALIPGALNAKGFEIFKDMYGLSKGIITPAAEIALAAINKGKEIEESIVEAEKAAEKAAKEAGKSTQEIELAKKEARDKIEESKKGELAAAAAAKSQEYDLMKTIDIEKIQQTYNSFAEVNKLTASQKIYLDDLQKQNQLIYTLTTKLTVADIQKVMLLEMQNDVDTFEELINQELTLLDNYKKDWEQIKTCMTQLSTNTSNHDMQVIQLKRLKEFSMQLEEQITQFNNTGNSL
ncbi:alpha-helical pore-forming toxin family protein (plasmid) [Bacillus cereus]|uniref:HBL/NHE enterotoxin family protein n=1 Tax=Bacillus cereus TaxID=1396 RepID=UPI001F28CEE0|nr:HBL/NHE enterotoxin family protein [Bacillus cereus]UIJ69598.1 alpha-helical pore-forming toxin family protein [Bacillus cereus]